MTTITIDQLKQDSADLKQRAAELDQKIADYEQQQKPRTINVEGMTISLKAGEEYIGTIKGKDRKYHFTLLPGEFKGTHADALKWAEQQGGELPDRVESALLFATYKSEFKNEGYWTREKYASASGCAWFQYFDNGYQGSGNVSVNYRARAVRRINF